MSDKYAVQKAVERLAQAFCVDIEKLDLEAYRRALEPVTNFQLQAAVNEILQKGRCMPKPLQLANAARNIRARLGKQEVILVDILGNQHKATLSGSARVTYCPTCGRVEGAKGRCALCIAGCPTPRELEAQNERT